VAPRAKSDALGARRSLQIAVGIAGLVPVIAGLTGVLSGLGLFSAEAAANVSLDSHYRYLSGLLLGIGLAVWFMIPTIESSTGPLRLLTFVVVIGGLARLLALVLGGSLTFVVAFGLLMELVVTPALCWWQARIASGNA
jgi:hypothetical protein